MELYEDFKERVPVNQFVLRELGGVPLRAPEPEPGSEILNKVIEQQLAAGKPGTSGYPGGEF